ncbi:ABC transporter permease [Aquicella lusitana]|uniref:Transport permease protein n=1 Tax=Aquicella lusitana TaxID=254246 RepID=A0A370H250_9COXI|nr:ABC transporter permease [Aquicella lusitana]RDI48133.1 lipopolysaccharide transport system permease protein [Aquicella lusitana]VVC72851.1 Teichoic acid translocation permease protein TagG [Aquicella lusitana]
MSKVIYVSTPERFSSRLINPVAILADLSRYRELITSMTIQNFRSTYQASYLGIAWQVVLPLIMLSIFYFVFGVILGGRFSSIATESRLDYALALFVGLGFFNFLAQNIGAAPSVILSNMAYVKSLAFPLEVLPVTTVLTSFITLVINVGITMIVFLLAKGNIHASSICTIFYLLCILLTTLGVSWILSTLAVFFRDISAFISPLTIILMFMCPIFYPASMVPKRIKWVIEVNPIAVMIENVRACMLYGVWPSLSSIIYVFLFSLIFAVMGYCLFMRSKTAFADVM